VGAWSFVWGPPTPPQIAHQSPLVATGLVQIAEHIILRVVASLVVHCCAIEKNIIVASQLYDVADEQFTVLHIGVVESRQRTRAAVQPLWE